MTAEIGAAEADLDRRLARTILTVDDSVSIRRMVAFTLKSAGFSVLEALDGAEGLEKARSQVVDLVLTDQNMPRMDGISLVRALRGLPQYRATPILVLTTESGEAMKAQGRAAGATGWLVKPFNPQRLLEVVNKVLGQAQSSKQSAKNSPAGQ